MKSSFLPFPPSVAARYGYGFEVLTDSADRVFACLANLGTQASPGRPLVADVQGDDGPDIEGLCRLCASLPKRRVRRKRGTKRLPLLFGALCLLVWTCPNARAQGYTTVASFNNNGLGSVSPNGELTMDGSGNIWGTTYYGGTHNNGTLFEYSPATHTLSNKFSFGFGSTGSNPAGGLASDGNGNFFGVTAFGGEFGFGSVYEFTPASGHLTTIWSFPFGMATPNGPVIVDSGGNIFLTTIHGGSSNLGGVIQIVLLGEGFTPWVSFNGSNGSTPYGGVITDTKSGAIDSGSGHLYGTTSGGGPGGYGTVYELTGRNNLTTLASFSPGEPGSNPSYGLVMDAAGNLYGTTLGTVFEVDAATHALTTFATPSNFGVLTGGVVVDANGNLYGTEEGSIFKVDAVTHAFTELANVTPGQFGYPWPTGGVLLDGRGDLFATLLFGGPTGEGSIVEVSVPEPQSLYLPAVVGVLAVMRRRRSRNMI